MIELYFILYRIPKMMSALARERNRSALLWSLIGIASWIGSEFVAAFSLGMFYAVGRILWGWPKALPAGFRVLIYAVALAAAIAGFMIARRILYSKSPHQQPYTPPPPPPRF